MIPKVCAIGILLAFVGFLLSETGFKGKRVFGLLSAVTVLIGVLSELTEIFSQTSELFISAGVSDIARAGLKIVGLGYVFGISSEVAEQLGEVGVSRALTLFGRIEIVGLTLPYVKSIIELGTSLIK